MYVHVPSAWLAYLSFFIVFVASVAYLRTHKIRWDRLAAASAEVGVLFTALTIVLGMLWGKPVWGAWWTWDPRITTTTILLLIYMGYLAVRRLPESPARRARWAAVIGVVGFVDVPIVQLSVTWWRSLHQGPTVRLLGETTMAPVMLAALLVAVGAFTLLYCYLVALPRSARSAKRCRPVSACRPRARRWARRARRSCPVDSLGYVIAGYLVTAGSLGGFVLSLLARARRARRLAEAVAARRDDRT